MKRILSLIIAILIFLPTCKTNAQENHELICSIEPNICGEVSNIQLLFNNLPFIIDSETTIVINFPIGFTIPHSIKPESVIIDIDQNPISINVASNSIHLKIGANLKNLLAITFLKSASIRNPNSPEEESTILVFFADKNFFIESNPLTFKNPENSIMLERDVNITATSGWIPKEFNLRLSSKLATEIYYSLDEDSFSLYEDQIMIKNGIHTLKYYGVRNSGAKENINSTTFYVDSVAPSIKLIDPLDGSFINEVNKELVFAIEDFSPVTIFLGENKTYVDSTGIAKIKQTFKPGENKLEVVAIDSANYKTELSFTVFVDLTPPTLLIISPKKGSRICGDTVDIIGKAEIGSEVFLDNLKVKLDTYGNFTFKYLPKAGKNKVTIKAIDKAKNETIFDLEFFVTKAKIIEYFIGKNTAIVDGVEKEINPTPFIDSKSGEVYVSLRFTATNLGFKLTWNDKGSYAVLSYMQREIYIKPYDNIIKIKSPSSEVEITLKNPPTIFDSNIVIPIEFLNKVLNGDVIYKNSDGKIISKFCL